MSPEDDEPWVCGENFDHTCEVTYEDAEVIQWECSECGAEGWEDK